MIRALAVALLIWSSVASAALADDGSNGLALTPPMGWNSWNRFGCNVNEQVVRGAADAMVSSGMKDAGYRYIIIDDCWQIARDAAGNIVADKTRFPSGIKALAAYIHAKGLKFGIYSDAGTKTCGGRPGSHGHETQDAKQYAAWGVDYLKYDWCNTKGQDAVTSYRTMSEALRASGTPIVFSLCEWGSNKPWLWGRGIGNLWRTTGDIYDQFDGKPANGYSLSVLEILDKQMGLAPYAGPGHWNDPDMLEVGNGGMSDDKYRAHFSLWAILAAPLIAGNDLPHMDEATRAILTNRQVIAVDQDALGQEGTRVAKDGDAEVWARPLANGGRAAVLLNRGTAPRAITVTWPQLNLAAGQTMRVRDLWRGEDVRTVADSYSATVEPRAIVMVRLDP
ncbi:MAG TPA: glycoside hydrolase family 27 protein [Rhizomicrobium sp.]|jgi:alpha-galactosidase